MQPIMLLLALVAGVLAGPINVRYNEPNICSTTCTESSKFKYEPGTTYVFDYNVQTETSMEGASEDKAVMGIKATAHVEVMSKCDMALRLSDVRLYPRSNSEFADSLEDQALRFSFQDGKIEDLCPVDGESDWVLNIKRGILSTFQNSMDNLELDQTIHEIDVTGKCPAEYKLISKGWYTKAIQKTKNLLGCMDRHGWRSAVHASPYRIPSELQSLPLMKSEHVCEQEIEKRGYVKSTVCKETHVFRPFSHYNNGSSTKVLQKLTFNRQVKQTTLRPSKVNSRTTMLFTHSDDHQNIGQNQRQVEAKLAELCTKSKDDIRPEVPEIFAEMIFLMRSLDATSLRDIYRKAERGSICRDNTQKTKKFFLDAIPMVSTSGSVQLLKELLISKAVVGTEAEMWLTSLALVQSPTREMIAEVKAVLNIKELQEKAMLPITSLVNNYCSKNSKCSEEYEVTGIISTLERYLGYGCYVRDENLEKVLLTLRAIGNAGHSQDVGSAVSNCFTRQSNPAEVRVTALDAFRRLPCSVDRSEPLSILRDTDEDSEIRIAAYLAIMKCPTDDVIRDVRIMLETEEANQVSSFIWSHLTNLMETSSPHKQSIRDIVEDQRLKKSFDLERIKYSRNYEGSFMLESLNTGAMAESNVIWSSKSFIPRSAMVNLTVDMFGSSVNLFEMGGRVEGLEYLLETYLGPFGYFGEKSTKDSIAKSREQLDKLRASMYMRMFGNEMSFNHFKGIKAFNSEKFNYLDFLIKISKEHDYSYSQSMMFLDSSVIIPTTSGLPLNLTVTGVSSMDLKASGSVDLRKVATSPRSLNIDGTIKPSGAVTITGAMTVDAYVTKTGMKMTSTLHSSTAVTGRIRLERGKILEVVFDMPQDKMEVLDVKSRFFTINGETEREQDMITENRKEKIFCTGDKLAKIVGLELCGELKFSNASLQDAAPYFPFTGPTTMSLVLHKRDTHAGYKLLAKRVETKEQSIAQIAFDTPGSTRAKRAIAMDIVLNFPNKHLEVSTTTPWTEMLLNGKVINEKTKKAFIGSFVKDGERYSVNSIVDVKTDGPLTKLSPRVEIVRPRSPKIILAGSMDIEGTKRFATDLSLVGAINHPISVKGSIVDTKMEKSVEGRLQFDENGEYIIATKLLKESRKTSMKITPSFEIRTPTEHVTLIDGNMDYRQGRYLKGDITATIKKLFPKPIEIRFKNTMKEDKKKNIRYDLDVFVASKWLSGKIDGNMLRNIKGGQTTARLSVDYKLPKGKKNKFIVSGKFNDKCTKSIYKYILNVNMDVKRNPEYNWVANLDMSHNKKHSDASALIKYGKDLKDKSKQIELSSTLNRKGNLGAASINYKIISKIPALGVDVTANGDHKHDRKYLQNNMVVNYSKGKSIKTAVKLYDRSRKYINMGGEIDLKYPKHQLNLNTDFDQKRDQYVHKLNFKWDKMKSSITTNYTNPNSKRHEIASEIFLDSFKPITVGGMVNLDLNKFKSTGEFIQGSKKYGYMASKSSSDMLNHVMNADVYYPGREISTDVITSTENNKYTGKVSTNWNKNDKKSRALIDVSLLLNSLADMDGSIKLVYPDKTITINAKHLANDKVDTHVDVAWSPREKIDLDFTHSMTENYRAKNMGTSLVITTPFRMVPKIATDLTYNNDNNGIKTTSAVSWGRDQITANVLVKKPYSASAFEAEASVTTPFNGFRRMSSDITHRFTDKVYTTMKGKLEDKYAEVILKAGLKGDPRKEIGMDTSLTLKSNIRNMESMSAQISHVHDLQKFTTDIVLDNNGDQYVYDLDMSVNNGQWKFENVGKLMLASPYYRINTNWNHLHTEGSIKTTINSDWGRGRKVYIDFSGSHVNSGTRKIDGRLAIQTPWEELRDMELNLNHEFGRGIWNYNGNLKSERQVVGSSKMNYRRGAELVTFDVSATSPYSEDFSGAMSISTQMPYTGRIEAQWSADRKISADGSLNGNFPSNIEGTFRITTPFRPVRSVFATASNKKEGGEWITSSTVEYGVRKTIKLQTRVGFNDFKKVRVQLLTPYDILRRIESGIEFNAGTYDLNGKADFEVVPVIGKFSSSINANWGNDMSAKARLETPFPEFPYAQFDASSSKDTKGRHSQLEIEYSPRQLITLDNHYNFNGPMMFDISMKTPFTNLENVGANLRYSAGRRGGFTSDAEITYAPYKTITGDIRVKMNRGIDATVKVTTPINGYKTSNVRFTHTGVWTDFNTFGLIDVHNKKYDADIRFQHGEETSTSITVHTPFNKYQETKYTMEKKGNMNNLDFTTTLVYGQKQEMSLALGNKVQRGMLKTDVVFLNPYTEPFKFNVDHYGLLSNFQTKVSSSFGRDNMIDSTTKVTIRLPKIDISSDADYLVFGEGRKVGIKVNKEGEWMDMSGKIEGTCDTHTSTLTGSFKFLNKVMGALAFTTSSFGNRDISMSFSHEGPLQRFQTEGNVKYLDNEMSGKLNWYHDGLRQINSAAELSTPFQGFEQMRYDYQHALVDKSFTGNGKVSYGYNQQIIGDVAFAMEPAVSGSVTLKTPFEDYQNNRIAFKGEGSMTDFRIHGEGELFGERLDIDSNLSHDSMYRTEGLFNMKATSRKIRDVSVSFNNRGSIGNFAATGTVNYAGKKIMEGRVTSIRQPSKTAYTVNLQCMFMEDVDASFEHTGTSLTDCHTKLSASLGNLITGNYNSDMAVAGNDADIHLDGAYKYYDMSHEAVLNLKKEGEWTNGKMSADGKINNQDASASATYNIRRNYVQVGAMVNTPFDGFRDLAASVDYVIRRQRVVKAMVRYMDGQEVSSEMKLFNDGYKNVKASTTVNTPFRGYERTTAKYNHALDDTSLTSDISVDYGRNQQIATKLQIESDKENKFEIEVSTPFEGYRDTKFAAKMNKNRSTPSARIILKNGRTIIYSLEGEMDLESTLMNGEIHMTTPFNMYSKNDITFTHSGEWSDFRSTAKLNSRLTGEVEGDLSFVYNSPKSFDTSVALKSDFANFEDLSFNAKNTPNREGVDTVIVAEWAPMKKIEFDSSYDRHPGLSSETHAGSMSISTPFEAVKSATMKMSFEQAGDKYTEKLTVSHNDEDLIDITTNANLGDNKDITVDVDSPRPMQMVLSLQKDHAHNGEIFLNWNKREQDSNVRLRGSVTPNGGRFDTDKDFEVKLIHPARTMGVSGTLQSSDRVIKSKGALLWNENKGQRFSYDLDMSSNNRRQKQMMDSSLKIELPSRTLVFTGVINKNSYEQSIDGSVMWDAAEDQSKKVGVKATFTPGSKTNKMEVVLNLPTIQRDIRVGSEMTLDNGKVIFDGKTEFSYSSDSRKTLVLTSNLKDVSYDRSLKNYTMSLGISHPYTNTDLFVISHLGRSTDKLSTGMSMQYLTASRQRMNMMLLGEIDQLRRRINVDVISPMKRVKVVGEVDSITPFHASINNEIDNQPGMSAELAVDCDKKTFDFQAKYDPTDLSNTLYIEGRYPNRSAIRAEAYTIKQGRRISESIMGIRLNTSRIIHTKVTWRPQISQEIQAMAGKGYRSMVEEMTMMNKKIREELAGKFSTIAGATVQELTPFVEMIERELADLGRELEKVATELRRMYGRNDLFIKDMGEYVQEIYHRAQASLKQMIEQYNTMTATMIQDLTTLLQTLQQYPIRERYYKLVNTIQMYRVGQMEKMSAYLDEVIADLKEKTQMYTDKYSQHILELKTKIANHHSVQGLKRKIAELQQINYARYISDLTNTVGQHVGKLNLPERYNTAITNVHSVINNNLDSIMRREEMKYLHSVGNEVYQQGKWAYGYWRVEENVRNQLHQIVELVKELIKEEYTKYRLILGGPRVNVTVYDPVNGEFQADIYTVIPLETLDEIPSNYVDNARHIVTNYLPSKDTVIQMYNNYFPETNTTDPEFKQELNDYIHSQPKRRMNRRRRGKKARK